MDLINLKENLTVNYLAEKNQISEKSIRNDLKSINDLLSDVGLEKITVKRGGLIKAPVNMEQILPHITSRDYYSYKLSRDERVRIAAVLMVSAVGYITLSDIADSLYVSRATIINDLPEIRSFVSNEGLKVVSQPNKGIMIIGTEIEKRKFIYRVSAFEMGENHKRNSFQMVNTQSGNMIVIQKILNEQLEHHACRLDDGSFLKVRKYLSIMIDRVQKGEYVEPQPSKESVRGELARDIMRYLAQYVKFRPSEDEVRYLADILERCRYNEESVFDRESVHIQLLTRRFINAVSEDLEIKLNNDYEFFESLSHHLRSMFDSDGTALDENAAILEIVQDNEEIFSAVQKSLYMLEEYKGRPMTEYEVYYITVHVCAAVERKRNREIMMRVIIACHAGIGTSKLLLEKVKKNFNFKIVDVISAHEASSIKDMSADFIISTVPLRNCPLEYVLVNPLMTDEDYIRIGNKIDTLRVGRNIPNRIETKQVTVKGVMECIVPILHNTVPECEGELTRLIRRQIRLYLGQHQDSDSAATDLISPMLHQLLMKEHIQLDVECCDWKEAVKKSALPLLERGYIEERYITAMIDNIEENGPYVVFSPGFAVPHEGLECGSIRVGMNLIRLKHPVDFHSEEYDPVRYVCCLSAIDHKTHLRAFFNLVNLLTDEDFREELDGALTPAEVSDVIIKYEYDLEDK